MCRSEPFLVILSDTLLRRSKFFFFTFESADTWKFLDMRDASFSCQILLKLIYFKSFNRGVTWSRFKYFPLLTTFVTKFIHFCTSYCSFSLLLPHIELQWFRWVQVVSWFDNWHPKLCRHIQSCHCCHQDILIRRWSQQRRLLVRDVNQRNSVLTNSYSLVYILHFVSAVAP